MSIAGALVAFFAMLVRFLKLETPYIGFRSKEVLKKHDIIPKFVIDTIN